MSQPIRSDDARPTADVAQLEERLRRSLEDARGNVEIRRRLVNLVRDPQRFEALRRDLGFSHPLLRHLRRLAP